jgi:hypothetical protein
VETTADGTVNLTCGTVAEKRAATPATPTDEGSFGKIVVTDTSGGSQIMLFAGALDGTEDQSYKRPPLPPEGFDARFSDNTWLSEDAVSLVQIRSYAFPVTVTVERLPLEGSVAYTLYEWVAGTDTAEHELVAGTEFVITNTLVAGLRLAPTESGVAVEEVGLPGAFKLLGNYPNPFNPTTTVAFDLPSASRVDLEVYDLLGRRVLSVPARDFAAGAGQRLTIDAASLASGTYVSRLRSVHGNEVNVMTGRMTLLKSEARTPGTLGHGKRPEDDSSGLFRYPSADPGAVYRRYPCGVAPIGR